MNQHSLSLLTEVADLLAKCHSAFAFTGAGISTESGIPDFRSPGGVWSKNRTVYFDQFLSSKSERHEYWRQKSITHQEFSQASPNMAHEILTKWEQSGRLKGVVTQNIDGLHQSAGSQNVLELHGTAREVGCLSCEQRWDADDWVQLFLDTDEPPHCPDCNGFLKHATVSFGQALPEQVFEQAIELARSCDVCLALGSSLVVYPAASIPEIAAQQDSKLVIINNTETPLDQYADVVVRHPLGDSMQKIDELMRSQLY